MSHRSQIFISLGYILLQKKRCVILCVDGTENYLRIVKKTFYSRKDGRLEARLEDKVSGSGKRVLHLNLFLNGKGCKLSQ